MSKRCYDLPIILGGGDLKKGVITSIAPEGGYDLFIVWLKREYQPGAKFALEDIEKLQAMLHFCNRETVERVINSLMEMLGREKDINE